MVASCIPSATTTSVGVCGWDKVGLIADNVSHANTHASSQRTAGPPEENTDGASAAAHLLL